MQLDCMPQNFISFLENQIFQGHLLYQNECETSVYCVVTLKNQTIDGYTQYWLMTNTLRLRQNGRHFPLHYANENGPISYSNVTEVCLNNFL